MQKQVQQDVGTFQQVPYLLDELSSALHACDDLKNLLIKVNALPRAIFEEINRRSLLGCTIEKAA